jgi:hypothetical protein
MIEGSSVSQDVRNFGRNRVNIGHVADRPDSTLMTQTGLSEPSIDALRKVHPVPAQSGATLWSSISAASKMARRLLGHLIGNRTSSRRSKFRM